MFIYSTKQKARIIPSFLFLLNPKSSLLYVDKIVKCKDKKYISCLYMKIEGITAIVTAKTYSTISKTSIYISMLVRLYI